MGPQTFQLAAKNSQKNTVTGSGGNSSPPPTGTRKLCVCYNRRDRRDRPSGQANTPHTAAGFREVDAESLQAKDDAPQPRRPHRADGSMEPLDHRGDALSD
jgi:hypothetical protein